MGVSFTLVNDTQITATTQAHAAGAVAVAVTTLGGAATLNNGFTYTASPTITSQPSNATISAGGNTIFSTAASNATGYQWQVNSGSGYANISDGGVYSGATTSTLTITGATAGMNGYLYRVVVSGSAAPDATSNAATLTVHKLTPTVALAASSANPDLGSSVTFTATLSGGSSPTGTVTFRDGSTPLGTATINGYDGHLRHRRAHRRQPRDHRGLRGHTDNAAATSSPVTVTVGQAGAERPRRPPPRPTRLPVPW